MKSYLANSNFYAFATLVLICLGAAGIMVPSSREMALIELRDNEFDSARVRYELLLKEGHDTVDVYVGLVDLYLQLGDIDRAIEVLEQYAKKNPKAINAREKLDVFYDYAQRPEDRIRNLRALVDLDPTEMRMRALIGLLANYGRDKEEVEVLTRFVDRFRARPQDLLHLAELQVGFGMLRETTETLGRLWRIDTKEIPPEAAQLWVAILANSGDDAATLDTASRILKARPDMQLAALLAETLESRGKAPLALAMLKPYLPEVEHDLTLAEVVTRLFIETRQLTAASETLERMHAKGTLNLALRLAYVEVALDQSRAQLALDLSDEIDPRDMPDSLLYGLIRSALEIRKPEAIRAIKARIDDDRFRRQPVLAAQFATALDMRADAERWVKLVDESRIDVDDSIALAGIYVYLGRDDRATQLALRLADDPLMPETGFAELAGIFLTSGQAEQGLRLFDKLLAQRPSEPIEEGWARLAFAAGKSATSLAWLNARSDERLSFELLLDLYYIANDATRNDLTLATAERVYRRRGNDDDRRNLAAALIENGTPERAVPLLKPDLASSDREIQAAAVFGLIDAKAWTEVLPTLSRLATAKPGEWLWDFVDSAIEAKRPGVALPLLTWMASRTDLSKENREEALYALLEVNDPDSIVPALRNAARDLGDPWVDTYEETLESLGRTAELIEFLRGRALRPDLPIEQRRDYAYDLLEKTNGETAMPVFKVLAESDTPDGPDTEQLLELWGTPLPGAALDWLEQRAHAATLGSARAGWLNQLVESGAPGAERALRIVQNDSRRRPDDDDLNRIEAAALELLDRNVELGQLIARVTTGLADRQRLEYYGRLAMDGDQFAAARKVYDQILAIDPKYPPAIKANGILKNLEGNYDQSVTILRSYSEIHPEDLSNDWEFYYYLGLSLDGLGRNAEARRNLQLSLQIVDRLASQSGEGETTDVAFLRTRGRLLNLLGRQKDAIAVFEGLVQQHPTDLSLRAEFVDLLLISGERGRAEQILQNR